MHNLVQVHTIKVIKHKLYNVKQTNNSSLVSLSLTVCISLDLWLEVHLFDKIFEYHYPIISIPDA